MGAWVTKPGYGMSRTAHLGLMKHEALVAQTHDFDSWTQPYA